MIEALKKVSQFLGRKKFELQPRNKHVSPPVAQVFIRRPGVQSAYTLSNFPSLYSPATADAYVYDVVIYGEGGEAVAKKSIEVPPFASVELVPEREFSVPLPELGVFAAGIRSKKRFFYDDRHLGVITPHFYVCYRASAFASIGVIHPQTTLGPGRGSSEPWTSNQLLSSQGLRRISLVQMNSNLETAEVVLRLHSRARGVLAEKAMTIGPLGVKEAEWELGPLDVAEDDLLFVSSPRLPSPNGKPLLFCHFENGSFTASHA